MVGASELAFRMFVRTLGVRVTSTPMIYAEGFVRSESYRREFKFAPADRPLILQICTKDPESAAKATRLVEDLGQADAIELNVGCPQRCARKGGWGAFLMRDPDRLCSVVEAMIAERRRLPVFVKMRVYEDKEKTVALAKRLETCGVDLLTVHGRTIEKKRSGARLADWDVIAKIKAGVAVPVVSNGNIRNADDVRDCLRRTKCNGVMSACGLLANPALFMMDKERQPPSWSRTSAGLALKYLEFAERYEATAKQITKHIHWMLNPKRGEVHRVKTELCRSKRASLMKSVHAQLVALERGEKRTRGEKRKRGANDAPGRLEALRKAIEDWVAEENDALSRRGAEKGEGEGV